MPNWPLSTVTQNPPLFLSHQDLTWCSTGNGRAACLVLITMTIRSWKYVKGLLQTSLFTYHRVMVVCMKIISWEVPRTCWSKQLASFSLNQSCHGFSLITGIGVQAKEVSKYKKVSFIGKHCSSSKDAIYEQKCAGYSCPSAPVLSNKCHKMKGEGAHRQRGWTLLARHHKSKSNLNVHKE